MDSSTYDHRVWRTGLPVRSAVLKPRAGQLVVWWVTTCESWLFCAHLLHDENYIKELFYDDGIQIFPKSPR
ncbi:uncharacterized protein N7496_000202 [Penicillium cataractarum]|uniref:Uncharacterized protein n=1 Tax=Penicillium cataractarum TaxID=2100454 RepID=A0A9X0B5P6_9EURO|nr:uncharacterized protein N7496_000202 [Penicillium cataractarum]KAJ5389134.1 hypothetical protein N7496_000202 [Penicillium cataractarum]